jgi:hypothetical protein
MSVFIICLLFSGCASKALSETRSPDSTALLHVEIGLEKYAISMNSVPGYPFLCKGGNVQSVSYSVDSGGFLFWGPPDYKVKPQGKEVTVPSGVAVYWSPPPETSSPAIVKITIIIHMEDGKLLTKLISISRMNENGSFYYEAHADN